MIPHQKSSYLQKNAQDLNQTVSPGHSSKASSPTKVSHITLTPNLLKQRSPNYSNNVTPNGQQTPEMYNQSPVSRESIYPSQQKVGDGFQLKMVKMTMEALKIIDSVLNTPRMAGLNDPQNQSNHNQLSQIQEENFEADEQQPCFGHRNSLRQLSRIVQDFEEFYSFLESPALPAQNSKSPKTDVSKTPRIESKDESPDHSSRNINYSPPVRASSKKPPPPQDTAVIKVESIKNEHNRTSSLLQYSQKPLDKTQMTLDLAKITQQQHQSYQMGLKDENLAPENQLSSRRNGANKIPVNPKVMKFQPNNTQETAKSSKTTLLSKRGLPSKKIAKLSGNSDPVPSPINSHRSFRRDPQFSDPKKFTRTKNQFEEINFNHQILTNQPQKPEFEDPNHNKTPIAQEVTETPNKIPATQKVINNPQFKTQSTVNDESLDLGQKMEYHQRSSINSYRGERSDEKGILLNSRKTLDFKENDIQGSESHLFPVETSGMPSRDIKWYSRSEANLHFPSRTSEKPKLESIPRKILADDSQIDIRQEDPFADQAIVIGDEDISTKFSKTENSKSFAFGEIKENLNSIARKEKYVIRTLLEDDDMLDESDNPICNKGRLFEKMYLISAKWWRQWKEFVNFSTTEQHQNFKDSTIELRRKQRPGSIKNWDMIDTTRKGSEDDDKPFLNTGIKDNLLHHHDYEVVNDKIFSALKHWYGCDVEIFAFLKEDPGHQDKLVLDLYGKNKILSRQKSKKGYK